MRSGSAAQTAPVVLLGLAAYRARNPHIDLRDRVRPHVADGHRWSVRLARDLVRAMLDAGADRVLIGPRLRIGTSARVISGPNHDDRLHAMF